MRKLLLLFTLLITKILYANTVITEGEPSAIVQGVHVITGDLYLKEEDVVIQGVEPIRLQRTYISQKGKGYWQFLNSHVAFAKSGVLEITEQSGAKLYYRHRVEFGRKTKHNFELLDLNQDGQGVTNTSKGVLSGNTNLKNQRIEMKSDEREFTVHCPNGTKKIYKKTGEFALDEFFDLELTRLEKYTHTYVLTKEILPNGNQILYKWPKKRGECWEIKSCDRLGKETYAWARFHPKNGKHGRSHGDYGIETSDGRHIEHFYFTHRHFHQLRKVTFDEHPEQTYHYSTDGKRRFLHEIELPEGRNSHISYYNPGDDGIQKEDPLCYRVKELKAPLGENQEEITSHRFIYDLDRKKTTVLDAYGIPTDYYWNDDLRLVRIDRFLKPNVLYNREKFIWGDNSSADASNILCKLLFDELDQPISATRYFYDSYGNVKEERFYGNLTGKNSFFELDEKGFPKEQVECYTKRFEYSSDGKNLLKKREEDNGLSVSYKYLLDTPLLEEEVYFQQGVPQKRKKYVYNEERRILIQEISEDLQGSTYLNTHFILKNSHPYFGMPEIIEERQGRVEKLLMKTVLLYEHGGRIQKKEIHDATGDFKYQKRFFFEQGKLVKEINPKGAVALSRYDLLNNKCYYKDFDSRSELHIQYDNSDRPYAYTESGEGLKTCYSCKYSYRHTKTESEDNYGNKTTYDHDPFGHLVKTTLPDGSTISSTYNASGHEILHIDGKGYRTETTFNIYGNPLSISYPDGTSEQFYYKKEGSLEKHIDQMGFETLYVYDVFGRPLLKENALSKESWTYSGMQLLSHTTPSGHTTFYKYDEAGRKILETCEEETTIYTYDSFGRLYTIQNGDLKIIKEYDFLDNLTSEKRKNLKGDLLEEVSYAYDNAGTLLSTTKYIDGRSVMEEFFYDALLRLIRKTDGLGYAMLYDYAPHLNQKTTTDPLGLQITETLDFQDKVIHSETRSPEGDLVLKENYSYDLNQNLVKTESIAFDHFTLTLQEYGPLDRLTTLIEGAESSTEKVTSYTYDPKGLLFQIIKPSKVILSHEYDSLGNLTQLSSSDQTIDYTYKYDENSLLQESKNNITKETLFQTYDHKGRLLSEKLPSGLFFQNTYDKQGRRKTFQLPDQSYLFYTYNALHLSSVSRVKNERTLYTHKYHAYDLSGNVLEEETIFGTPISNHYDNLNRHTHAVSPYFSAKDCVFDPAGNLLSMARQKEVLSYKYDSLHQLKEETGHTYEYDAHRNRLCKDDHCSTANSLNQTSDLTYDLDGNPIAWQDKTLIYDALDRLVEVLEPFKKTCYTYDSFHRRLSKKIYTLSQNNWELFDTLYFLYDAQNEIGSTNDLLQILELRILGNTYNAEIGAAIALELYGKTYLPIHDLQGNVATLISSSTLEDYSYSAFGEELFLAPPSLNPWRFSSKRLDPETGFIYYGRRYYLPELGRWLTPDPLGLTAGPNLYTFVLNSPLTHLDLYGLLEESKIGFGTPLLSTFEHFATPPFSTPHVPNPPSETFSVGKIENPNLFFGSINGLFTSPQKARADAEMLSEYGGGIKMTSVYSSMNFSPEGIRTASFAIAKIKTSPVDLIKQECIKFHDTRPKDKKMLWRCHSHGAALMYNALRGLSEGVQQRCIVLAIAPSRVIPQAMCFKSFNYVSKRDFVPFLGTFLASLSPAPCTIQEATNQSRSLMKILLPGHLDELVFLDPHPNAKPFDHDSDSPTFSKPSKDIITSYIKTFGGR